MKIGVFLGNYDPLHGGAYKLTEEIVRILSTIESNHHFIFLYENDRINTKTTNSSAFINILDKTGFTGINLLSSIKTKLSLFAVSSINKKMMQFQKQKNSNANTKKPSTLILNCVNYLYNLSKSYLINQKLEKLSLDCIWLTYPCELNIEIPYIITVFDLAHRQIPYFPEIQKSGWSWDAREKLYSKMLPKASIILSGNKTGADDIAFYYRISEQNIKILNFPTPAYKDIEISDTIKTDTPFIFYPAQYWPHKNHILIIRALNVLNKKYSTKINAIFCGSDKGNKDYLINQAQELGVYDQIKFKGFIEDCEIIELYKKSLALTYVSYLGPNNIPPQEALEFGCPIIISDLLGHREQVQNAAIFVSLNNPEMLAESIFTLSTNQEIRNNLIANGNLLKNNFSEDAFIHNLQLILDNLSNKLITFDRNGNYQ